MPSSRTLRLRRDEIERWDDISRRMYVPFHDDGIISQFEGYERLARVGLGGVPAPRTVTSSGSICILEAENDSAEPLQGRRSRPTS